MRDFTSPTLKRILDLQEKHERMFPTHRLTQDLGRSLSGFHAPYLQPPITLPSQMEALSRVGLGLQRDLLSQVTAAHTSFSILPKHLQALNTGFPSTKPKLMDQLLDTPVTAPYRAIAEFQLRESQGIIKAQNYVLGRTTWIAAFTPGITQFIERASRSWRDIEERDKEINRATEVIIPLFLEEGWYILPILYYSYSTLSISLYRALENSVDDAKKVFIDAFIRCKDDLLNYIFEKLDELKLPEALLKERKSSIESQINLACEGHRVEGVASFMVAEAEGIFNDVTVPLGMPHGCFYTNDPRKIQIRGELLDNWHNQIENSSDIFGEIFTRRHYKMFTRTRAKFIPERDQMQHGTIGFREQEHAIWATTFLILTIEYLNALVELNTSS